MGRNEIEARILVCGDASTISVPNPDYGAALQEDWTWPSRLTNRCSGPGWIKCLAAGEEARVLEQVPCARVLKRGLPAAERGR